MKLLILAFLSVSFASPSWAAEDGANRKATAAQNVPSAHSTKAVTQLSTAIKAVVVGAAAMAPSAAWAIRVLFNGGGYAEMSVINSVVLMPQILRGIINHSLQGRALSFSERKLIELALEDGSLANVKIDFFSDPGAVQKIIYPMPQHFSLQSEMLYDSFGKPLAIADLWEIGFRAWAQSPEVRQKRTQLAVSDSDVTMMVQRLRVLLQENLNYQWLEFANIKVHLLRFGKPTQLNSSLWIEFTEGTYDISKLVIEKLPCSGGQELPKEVEIERLESLGEAFTGQINWKCGNTRWQAVLMAPVNVDIGREFIEDQIKINIHSIQNKSEDGECDQVI